MTTSFSGTTEIFGSNDSYTYDKNDYIARGTFGIVYKGKINNFVFRRGTAVAVKVVHLNNTLELFGEDADEKWTKLRNRLQKLIVLKHDNLATYHTVSITKTSGGAQIELMMDYYAGGDLGSFIKKIRNDKLLFDEDEATRFAVAIIDGVKFLHQNNIIHGDLKPGNVLLHYTETGQTRPSIGDLDDLVPMQRSVTSSGDISHLRGTVRYMSPEMLRKFACLPSEPPGRKTDVWSVGCIILELAGCVTGSYGKQLVKETEVIDAGDKIPDTRFATMIIDGYVPFVPEGIPQSLSPCIRGCLEELSSTRLSAEMLGKQLLDKQKESYTPKKRFVFIHAASGLSSTDRHWTAQSFDPSTNAIRPVLVPARFQWNIRIPIGVLGNQHEIVCTDLDEKSNKSQLRFVALDPAKGTWRAVFVFGVWDQIACPMFLEDKMYYWVADNPLGEFVVMSVSGDNIISTTKSAVPIRLKDVSYGAQFNGKLVYMERFQSGTPQKIACFDTIQEKWEELPSLPEGRDKFALIILDEDIYILGGETVRGATNSCLRLNVSTRSWTAIGRLLQPRTRHCAFAFSNQIYVYGGQAPGQTGLLQTMEAYDVKENRWCNVSLFSLDSRHLKRRWICSYVNPVVY